MTSPAALPSLGPRSSCRRGLAALALAAALGIPHGEASAEPPRDPAAARALFDEAQRLLQAKDLDGACAKFQASYDLNPAVSVLLNLARCHEQKGKLTLAADAYQRALMLNRDTEAKARQAELDDFAKKALAALEPRIPKLRVVVSARPRGLRVLRDGVELPGSALDTSLPVDPGSHVVSADAPGHRHAERTIVLPEGSREEVRFSLELSPMSTAGVTNDAPPAARPVWPWVVTGVGLTVVGVGAGFGIDAFSASSTIQGCQQAPRCGAADGLSRDDVASLNRRKNTGPIALGVLGGVGALATTLGVWGLFQAGGAKASTAQTSVSAWATQEGAGASMRAHF